MRKNSKILWPDLEKFIKMYVFGPKWAIFDSFCPGMAKTRFFWEKAKMSLPYAYTATLCKKPEQTYERILRSRTDGRSNERTDERTNGRTNESEFVGPNSAPRGTKKVIKGVSGTRNCVLAFKMAIFYVFKLSPLRVTLIFFLKNYLKKFFSNIPLGIAQQLFPKKVVEGVQTIKRCDFRRFPIFSLTKY